MKRSIIAVLVVAGASGVVHADVPKQKAGLWETKVTRQIVDGRDLSAQTSAASKVDPAKMQEMLARVPPEQRAMVEARMKATQGGSAVGGGYRICVTEAMAAKHSFGGAGGKCAPGDMTTSGNKITFTMNCTHDGHSISGSGQIVINGDVASIHTETTLTDATGSHTSVTEAQSTYLGADCHGVKPIEIPAR